LGDINISASSNILVVNNISVSTIEKGNGIFCGAFRNGPSANITLFNNLTYNTFNKSDDAVASDGVEIKVIGINGNKCGVDPQFVDINTKDFHLQSTSPAINAGTTSFGTSKLDLDGKTRIVKGKIDIGAYEFTGKQTKTKVADNKKK
jgi:hypothetical protein